MARRNRERRPARSERVREQNRRLLVVTEGAITEPEYLEGFKRTWRALVDVRIAGGEGDPSHVVARAIELRDAAGAQSDPLGYDEVWVAFDRDEHAHFNAAIDRARACSLQVAASNPCFELWLLLHFRDNPGAQHRHAIQKLLAEHDGGAGKRVDFEQHYAHRHDDAATRARRLQAAADEAEEPHRNPTTGFFRLTEAIKKAVQG